MHAKESASAGLGSTAQRYGCLVRGSVGLLAVVAIVLACGAASYASPAASRALARQRALESYALMQRYFYIPATRSYDGLYPSKGHAQLWPYSQALSATLAIAGLPGGDSGALAALPRRISRLAAYRAPLSGQLAYAPVYGGRGNVFYDDNVWIGFELLDAASVLKDRADLVAAQRILAWLKRGWDTKAGRCSGGVYWLVPGGKYWNHSPGSHYRPAVSTVNAALLAVLLYERTHLRSDLRWAERSYAWSEDCLGTSSGLIADHIDAAGKVTASIHSYNQGAMIATAVNLYRVTHRQRYLANALRITDAALAAFSDPFRSGDEASLLAIFYGDLGQLASVSRSAAIRAAIASFANRAWASERDPATGLFHFGHTRATLLDQAAMVQVYSELARM